LAWFIRIYSLGFRICEKSIDRILDLHQMNKPNSSVRYSWAIRESLKHKIFVGFFDLVEVSAYQQLRFENRIQELNLMLNQSSPEKLANQRRIL
jgi:hypothetical protein